VQAYLDRGIAIALGMKIQYGVTDARRYRVEPARNAGPFDHGYCRMLIDKARAEISFAFSRGGTDIQTAGKEFLMR
jgi:hypothetical protein